MRTAAGLFAAWILSCSAPIGAQVPPFADLRPAMQGGKWGYMREPGRFAIEARFDGAGPFAEGLAPVRIDGRFGYIDERGEVRIPPGFLDADAFSSGLAAVRNEAGYGYIRPNGEVAIPPRFGWAGPFREGLAPYREPRVARYGYINDRGESVIPPRFAVARPFSGGLAAISHDGRVFGFINREGVETIASTFLNAGEFRENLAWVEVAEGRFGFIDPGGKFAIEPNFAGVGHFRNGVAPALIDGNWRVLGRSGKPISVEGFDSIRLLGGDGLIGARGRDLCMVKVMDVDRDGVPDNLQVLATLNDPDLVDVRFESDKPDAAIYAPSLWDFDHTPDKTALLTPEYRVSAGNTNISAPLSLTRVYMVMFQRQGKVEVRKCTPAIDPTARAKFP
ncbi:MAG: WG repeat-containing protein [Isosphaeraceae bacterium]